MVRKSGQARIDGAASTSPSAIKTVASDRTSTRETLLVSMDMPAPQLQKDAAKLPATVRVPWFVGATQRGLKGNHVHLGAGLNTSDPELERDPPAAPTPVTFPERRTYSGQVWSHANPPPRLQPLFSRILKPSDISSAHIEALNIQVAEPCPLEELVPVASDGTSYFPPLSPHQATNAASYADVTRADATAAGRRREFDERLAELRLDNDTGYRAINRTTKSGEVPPRLAYMRKFWEGLESVALYWDTSLDQYYEGLPSTPDGDSEKDAKRQRLGAHNGGPSILTLQATSVEPSPPRDGTGTASGTSQSTPDDDQKNVPPPVAKPQVNGTQAEKDRSSQSTSATPKPPSCLRYKGRRIASGRDMPDQFRVDTVKALVEGVAWSFQAAVAPPRQMPIAQINTLNLPVRQSAAVYRLPKQRSKQRQGWLEGPVLCVQVRADTEFDASDLTESQRETKSRLDAMREIGGLLHLAQERQREGKTEARPGEGKWWTFKPRWGGGPGGEAENSEGEREVKDVLQMAEEMVSASREKSVRRPKKKTSAMLWKEIKPGNKLWDPKTEYQAIGKEEGSEYDEVFMVSSLNHHISILKLTVHLAYTEYTKTETLPDPLPSDENWGRPRLQRTKWYDLLDVDQRVEAFRALWGIMSYLMREPNEPTKAVAAAQDANMQES